MDSTQYYSQASSSQYQNQYEEDARANLMQVAPVDTQAINRYINDLYRNPSHSVAPPSNDPAFFAKTQHDLMNVKHRLEQMLLVNQQQAEVARMTSQG